MTTDTIDRAASAIDVHPGPRRPAPSPRRHLPFGPPDANATRGLDERTETLAGA